MRGRPREHFQFPVKLRWRLRALVRFHLLGWHPAGWVCVWCDPPLRDR